MFTDRSSLLERQYATAQNLRTRIALHERFSTGSQPFPRWVFDHLQLPERADILEVGCGNGNLWAANRERIPSGWRLTLTDFSQGMIDEAQSRLGDLATYGVADIQELPFASGAFDSVIANHMLYHVPDLDRAFAEVARVLRTGGIVIATTNGLDHLRELRTHSEQWSRSFALENGAPQLERFFRDVEVERFPDSLEVTEIEPLLDFVRSLATPSSDDALSELAAQAGAEIARRGSFHVTTATGLFRAHKP
jgi:ubiquinone/menaquinone biosynthesis C-methylase UbiE